MVQRMLAVAGGLAFLVACGGSSMEGRWDGDCEVAASGGAFVWDVELDIDEDKGGKIEGEAELKGDGVTYKGDLEGDRDGADATLTFEIESGGYNFEVELDGTIEKDRFEGDCSLRGLGTNYLAQGDVDLARD